MKSAKKSSALGSPTARQQDILTQFLHNCVRPCLGDEGFPHTHTHTQLLNANTHTANSVERCKSARRGGKSNKCVIDACNFALQLHCLSPAAMKCKRAGARLRRVLCPLPYPVATALLFLLLAHFCCSSVCYCCSSVILSCAAKVQRLAHKRNWQRFLLLRLLLQCKRCHCACVRCVLLETHFLLPQRTLFTTRQAWSASRRRVGAMQICAFCIATHLHNKNICAQWCTIVYWMR